MIQRLQEHLEIRLHNKRSHCNEKPEHSNWRVAPSHCNYRKPVHKWRLCSKKINELKKKKNSPGDSDKIKIADILKWKEKCNRTKKWFLKKYKLILFLFSCSVMSDSLQAQGLQDARLPYPSLSPRDFSNLCPLSPWCHSFHPQTNSGI